MIMTEYREHGCAKRVYCEDLGIVVHDWAIVDESTDSRKELFIAMYEGDEVVKKCIDAEQLDDLIELLEKAKMEFNV